jgi:hypothetical protein
MNASTLSRGLGWFSIGLGLTELLAPRKLAQAIGVSENHDALIRMLGAREITSGLALLARPKPTTWMWSRVAGDIMDLSLLGAAVSNVESRPLRVSGSRDSDRRRLTVAIAAVAGITLIDLLVSVRLTQKPRPDPSWRYTPEGGRAGIARPSFTQRPPALEYPNPAELRTTSSEAVAEPHPVESAPTESPSDKAGM